MTEKTRAKASESASSLPGIVFCGAIIALASVVLQTRDSPPLSDYLSTSVASNKPYETFEDFYPHYIREHSQKETRQWHYVGTSLFLIYMLFNPSLTLPIMAGGLAAYSIMPFFRHLPNGLGEVAVFASVYLIGGRMVTRSLTKTFIPLVLGYSFAWIGHFFVEHNKPATFIYPTFSLMGDFRMIYDAIKSQSF